MSGLGQVGVPATATVSPPATVAPGPYLLLGGQAGEEGHQLARLLRPGRQRGVGAGLEIGAGDLLQQLLVAPLGWVVVPPDEE